MEILLKECFAVSYYSKGGFNYSILKDLPFDEYEIVIKETNRVMKELTEETADSGE